MPQFCILFYANYTILATQRGEGTNRTKSEWRIFFLMFDFFSCPPSKYHAPVDEVKL